MKIYFVTRIRGFFKHLIENPLINVDFDYTKTKTYEINTNFRRFLSKIGRSGIMDIFGYIQIPKCFGWETDLYASSNRFIHTDKPYIIYVENPTGLFHYRLNRKKSILGRRIIKRELNSSNLKGLIFMSKACANTFKEVCGQYPENIISTQVYPLVPLNKNINEELISQKCYSQELKLLFVSQGRFFTVKGGLEVLRAYENLKANGYNISLEIITKIDDLNKTISEEIKKIDGIKLEDFRFSYHELEKEYFSNHILLSPTSMDSFSLTVLEAMKSGLTILTSRLYAIPEMVKNNINGFLCDPQFWFFDKNNIPNPKVWNHRKETVFSGKVSDPIVKFLEEKIKVLYNNRDLLKEMSLNSYRIASTPPFGEEYIAGQWNNFFKEISKNIEK